MSYRGSVIHIHIAPDQGNPMQAVESVEAVRGRGLRGDRYFQNEGTFTNRTGCDITFIEQEALIAVEREYGIKLEAGVHRRNVTTRDIALTL